MGCGTSSPKVANISKRGGVSQISFDFNDEEEDVYAPIQLEPSELVKVDANSILQGVKGITLPRKLYPVVNYSTNSFPLSVASLLIDDHVNSTIDLPIISISRLPYTENTSEEDNNETFVPKSGRVAVLGCVEFFSSLIFENPESAVFIENLITWGAGYKTMCNKLLFVGFPLTIADHATKYLSAYGSNVECSNELKLPLNYDIVLLNGSSYDPSMLTSLTDFLNEGKTVFVCGGFPPNDHLSLLLLNEFLKPAGLSLGQNPMSPSEEASLNLNMTSLEEFTYQSLSERFLALLNDGFVEGEVRKDLERLKSSAAPLRCEEEEKSDKSERMAEFDELISTLRFHAQGFPFYSSEAFALADATWQLIEKIGFRDENGYFLPSPIHIQFAFLLTELIPKISPRIIRKFHASFPDNPPGVASKPAAEDALENAFHVDDESVNEEPENDELLQTDPEEPTTEGGGNAQNDDDSDDFLSEKYGYVIVDGQKKPIELSDHTMMSYVHHSIWNFTGLYLPAGSVGVVVADSPIIVQVGSHTTPLLFRPSSLKRWPCVTHRVLVSANVETEIASPFGGIVYLVTDTPKTVQVQFRHFGVYPCFISDDWKKKWEETKDSDAPWGEIILKHCTFVIPSTKMKEIVSLSFLSSKLSKLISCILSIVGAKQGPFHHIIFDCELPTDEEILYLNDILAVDLNDLPLIVDIEKPSFNLFLLLSYICFGSIADAFFDFESEITLSRVAAAYAMDREFPKSKILETFHGGNFQLYQCLWKFLKKFGSKAIAVAMEKLMNNHSICTTAEATKFFVTELSSQVHKPLPNLLEKFNHAGNVDQSCSERLLVFKMSENEANYVD